MLEEKKVENIKLDSIPHNENIDSTIINIDTSVSHQEIQDTIVQQVVNTDSINAAKDLSKLNSYFELAEIFYYNLNHPDSSIYYLNKIINGYSNANLVSKATFYLGTIYKSGGDSAKANEYFNDVIIKFPNTIYANESRKFLGMETVLQSFDSADSLISVADKLLKTNNKNQIPDVLNEALTKYPQSPLIPKVYFTLGWYYENVKQDKDSMMKYYEIVLKSFPNTNFAASVKPTYDYYISLTKIDSSGAKDSLNISDSLKLKDSAIVKSKDSVSVKTNNGEGDSQDIIIEKKLEKNEQKVPEKKESGEDSPFLKEE